MNKYSLDCSYFNDEFDTAQELVQYVIECGMDPNYEILVNGKSTGEFVSDLIVF
jgi:hypothetical protein